LLVVEVVLGVVETVAAAAQVVCVPQLRLLAVAQL
jgi:hypothetical protein